MPPLALPAAPAPTSKQSVTPPDSANKDMVEEQDLMASMCSDMRPSEMIRVMFSRRSTADYAKIAARCFTLLAELGVSKIDVMEEYLGFALPNPFRVSATVECLADYLVRLVEHRPADLAGGVTAKLVKKLAPAKRADALCDVRHGLSAKKCEIDPKHYAVFWDRMTTKLRDLRYYKFMIKVAWLADRSDWPTYAEMRPDSKILDAPTLDLSALRAACNPAGGKLASLPVSGPVPITKPVPSRPLPPLPTTPVSTPPVVNVPPRPSAPPPVLTATPVVVSAKVVAGPQSAGVPVAPRPAPIRRATTAPSMAMPLPVPPLPPYKALPFPPAVTAPVVHPPLPNPPKVDDPVGSVVVPIDCRHQPRVRLPFSLLDADTWDSPTVPHWLRWLKHVHEPGARQRTVVRDLDVPDVKYADQEKVPTTRPNAHVKLMRVVDRPSRWFFEKWLGFKPALETEVAVSGSAIAVAESVVKDNLCDVDDVVQQLRFSKDVIKPAGRFVLPNGQIVDTLNCDRESVDYVLDRRASLSTFQQGNVFGPSRGVSSSMVTASTNNSWLLSRLNNLIQSAFATRAVMIAVSCIMTSVVVYLAQHFLPPTLATVIHSALA